MEQSCFSEKTLTLSVLTAEFARCVLQTGAPVTARSFLLRGLPMTLALVLITALTAGAELRADSCFSGADLRSRVVCMDLSGEELAAADGENELFPEQLLQVVKEAAPQAPHLYESRNALLAPVLILTDGAIENAEIMLLLTETGNTRLTPAESQICLLYTSPSPRDLSTSRMPSSA